MSRRLTIALIISGSFHASCLALLIFLSVWNWKHENSASPGGVVYYNLNPGGDGSGGAGGFGAPKNSGEINKPTKLLEKLKSLPIKFTAKEKNEITVAAKNIPEKNYATVAVEKPGLVGSGEGDTSGDKTGTGTGKGEGLGNGKGSGIGSGEGPGGAGPIGSGGSGSSILANIRSKIMQAKHYPRQARSEGIEGVCGLQFGINPDGSVQNVQLTDSSGYPILDEAALSTVKRAAPFPFYAAPIKLSLKFSLKE